MGAEHFSTVLLDVLAQPAHGQEVRAQLRIEASFDAPERIDNEPLERQETGGQIDDRGHRATVALSGEDRTEDEDSRTQDFRTSPGVLGPGVLGPGSWYRIRGSWRSRVGLPLLPPVSSPMTPPPAATRRLIHKGRKFDFEMVNVRLPSGRSVEREVVRHPGAVVIIPVLDDHRVALIRNYRIALGMTVFECPAGTLEPPEPPETCASRELIEETGFRAATLIPLGWFYTTPGLTDEKMYAFVARGADARGAGPAGRRVHHRDPRSDRRRLPHD